MSKFLSRTLLLIILLLIFPSISFAQVVINEVMYSSSSKQWIEIYNNTDSDIDLTQYKILDNGASKDGHGVSAYVSGNNILPTHNYALAARIPSDFSLDYLFKSSLGIKTSGDIIILKLGTVVVDTVSFSDGAATGENSLQLQSDGTWISALPTPGAANSIESTNSNNTTNTSGDVSGASTVSSESAPAFGGGSTTNVSSISGQLEVSAGNDRTTSPGSPIWFQATMKKNTTGASPVLSWSFGDGNVGAGFLVSHEYKYPGDYVVVLIARAGDIFSVSRLKVKVAESSIFVSDEGKYLEISNNGVAEVNLFNWKIESGGKGFIFQPNTIILPHSSIKLDKNLLTMKGLDNSSGISLKNCLKEEIFAIAPVDKIDLTETSKKLENMKQEAMAIQAELPNQQTEIAKNDLVAGSLPEIATSSDNIIYEAPKSGGLISRLTNFIKRVFSK
jgi:hypothetical protein